MVYLTTITAAVLFISFGLFALNAFGKDNDKNILVTNFLTEYISGVNPDDEKNPNFHVSFSKYIITDVVLLLFMSNLALTFPLQLYPAHIIVENYLYKSWPKSKKR